MALSLGTDFKFSVEDLDGHWRSIPPVNAAADAVRKINAATEDWCARAAAKGEGYRLFRSDVRREHDLDGARATVDFQILAPGEHAPASGTVYGPWPGRVSAR